MPAAAWFAGGRTTRKTPLNGVRSSIQSVPRVFPGVPQQDRESPTAYDLLFAWGTPTSCDKRSKAYFSAEDFENTMTSRVCGTNEKGAGFVVGIAGSGNRTAKRII